MGREDVFQAGNVLGGWTGWICGGTKDRGPPKVLPHLPALCNGSDAFPAPPGIKNGWNYATRAEGSAAASRDSGHGGIGASGCPLRPPKSLIDPLEDLLGRFLPPRPQESKILGIT